MSASSLFGFSGRALLAVAVLVAGCEATRHTDPGNGITELRVSPGHVITATSQTLRFRATGFTLGGDSQSVAVSWTATGGTIDAAGVYVMGATVGAFAVTATVATPALTGSATVENRGPLSDVVAMPGASILPPGGTMRVGAYGLVAADSVTISPSYSATGGTIDVDGLFTAGATPGDYVVIVTANVNASGATIADTSAITIASGAPVPVASVDVTPDTASIAIGDTVRLTATPRDAIGNPLTDRAIAWSSDRETFATVDTSGLVRGVAAGSATVTATVEGHSASAAITVTEPTSVPVASVDVTPDSVSVAIGDTVRLTATPRDTAGNALTGRNITWSSTAESVATVDIGGLVTGVAPGSTTITGTVEGHSDTATITVTAPPESSYVFVGAGDISDCGNDNDEATALLLDSIPGTVYTTGDNAYSSGTAAQFQDCYDPTWGRHRERTRPSPGNHDYNTPGAAGYYAYFGDLAGPAGRGYYSFDLGAWHIVSLNSEIDMSVGSPQELWLREDLAASTRQCTLAYWHKPRFSSGTHHGNEDAAEPLWQALYDFGAEVVLAGHEHNYERFAPQTPAGVADSLAGIREFVVGTGGRGYYTGVNPLPTSEVFDATSFGVLKLTLSPGSYTWEFIPVAGASFTDSGSGACH